MLIVEYTASVGASLVTDRAYRSGQLIQRIEEYQITACPTYQTIQIGADRHINVLDVLAYLNHSCAPNTIVDTHALTITAARDISGGETLTFFYPSTEWQMAQPFICLCGAPQCVRWVAGARYLPIDILGRYFINQHIIDMLIAELDPPQIPRFRPK